MKKKLVEYASIRYTLGRENNLKTKQILTEKAFKDKWFNKKLNLDITKSDLVELLNIATKIHLCQFEKS